MALIEWREEFKVGVASVDHEHAELIGLLNQLDAEQAEAVGQAAALDFLGEVHAKISAHFALEEKEMRDRGYDQYADHKADHERLLDDIRDIMDRVEAEEAFDHRARRWRPSCATGSASISRPRTPGSTRCSVSYRAMRAGAGCSGAASR